MKYFHSIWYFFPHKIDKWNDRHRAIYNKKKLIYNRWVKSLEYLIHFEKKNELMW